MKNPKLPYEVDPYDHDDDEYLRILDSGLPNQHDRQKKIAVVGAGMAGLTAGWLLKRAGHNVTIFEVTGVMGGRVKTLRHGFTTGYYAEAGAMRIPKHHKLVEWLLKETELLNDKWEFPNYSGNGYYYINQRHVRMADYAKNPYDLGVMFDVSPWEKELTATRLFHVCLENYIKAEASKANPLEGFQDVASKLPDDSIPDNEEAARRQDRERTQFQNLLKAILHNRKVLMELDKLSLQQFLIEQAEVAKGERLSRGGMDHICTVQLLDMSITSSLAAVLRSFHNIYQADKLYQIENGMDQLPKVFVEGKGGKQLKGVDLREDIRHHSRVAELTWTDRDVEVHYESTVFAERRSMSFDLVVLAIPFPAVRHVRMFELASPEKRRAFRQLHYENACKILIEFKEAFWSTDRFGAIEGGRSITDLPIRQIFYPNKRQNHGRVLLASYTWGDESLHWTALDHETRLRFALRDLARVHSDRQNREEVEDHLRRIFVGGVSHNWVEDENTAGAFAFFAPYQGSTLFPYVWRPEGRLHYCGEHTSINPSWIEGAVESGIRAASEIWARLGMDPNLTGDDGRLKAYRSSVR